MNLERQLSDFESWVHTSAFIVYQSNKKGSSEAVLCDRNLWGILTYPTSGSQKNVSNSSDLLALCGKWKAMFERSLSQAREKTVNPPDSFFVDFFLSGRRKYRVTGIRLYDQAGFSKNRNGYFMFTLERMRRDSVNLPKIFRESKLSRREQEIVYQILKDKSNKEIALALGLSQNTVKVYLKNLMRKINVTSRAGIVSYILKLYVTKRHGPNSSNNI